MQGRSSKTEDESDEYYVVPEEALQFLPEEWRNEIQTMVHDGRAVLKSVDRELSQLSRLANSFGTLVTLKHVQKRLSQYRFAADMDAILDLDMLTTAFVVTYVRLQQGGSGSGFSRDALPERLRPVHDHIIELRNKRFAHNAGHHTVSTAMEIGFREERFDIRFKLNIGFQVGGATEWPELVDFVDGMIADRQGKIVAKLKEKTGREWVLPTGPAPESEGRLQTGAAEKPSVPTSAAQDHVD
ncbi:MAG: hypothetical protein Q8R82_20440 [Hyphomonadaceae bacterium]|nr:hypothetical protein [Hyphomonadaceae bacterium]